VWEREAAEDWLKEHGYEWRTYDLKRQYMHFRQKEPDEENYYYRTIPIGDETIKFVMEFPKAGAVCIP
jgi:hypothetical protein